MEKLTSTRIKEIDELLVQVSNLTRTHASWIMINNLLDYRIEVSRIQKESNAASQCTCYDLRRNSDLTSLGS